MDKYSREEFAECYALRGYGRKKDALAWLGDREEAREEDFERCWRDTKRPEYRRSIPGFASDGQNLDSAAHMGNSRGKSFNAEMAREIAVNDSCERGWRKRMKMKEEEEQ